MNEPATGPAGIAELLTDQFYQWERRGRGWTVWPEPVDLEPPFRPFLGHFVPPPAALDDGKIETGWSRFAASLFKRLGKTEELTPEPPPPEEEPVAQVIHDREDLIELQAVLPADLDIEREAFEEFLGSLHLCREPVAFEILGLPSAVRAQFVVHPKDAPLVRRQLQAFFPDAVFLPQRNFLEEAWDGGEAAIVEFGLGKEFMQPLASRRLDPFVGIVGALSELRADELGLFQVIFQPVRHPWAESILRAVKDDLGEPFFANAPELVERAEEKIAWPLYAVVARIATQAHAFDRAWETARDLAGSLRVFAHPTGNELIPLANDDYPFENHVGDVLRRQCRRCGMILNSDELIGFVHLPQSVVRTPKLARQAVKTKVPPKTVLGQAGLVLGENVHAGHAAPVALTPEQRVRHMHVIGASGTGKSTLLFNLIRADIGNGQGVAVLDPHGDLVDRVLGIVPESRVRDVVLLDPADAEYSIGFNILSAHSELEKRLLASDLVSVFQRLSTSWGDQMASVLRNGILAFLESRRGGTLADLRRFLLEPAFREQFLQTVGDPEIVYYWRKGFPQLGGNKSIGPVLTRLDTFLSPKAIRYMVSQQVNRLDFGAILDTGKILLAKLAQGLIGKENSYLLGTLLVAKLQQLAMARQAQAAAIRKDFWLYVDEFHNFITPSMAEILTGARKYRLGLILAHQELRQLQRDSEVASAVLSNSGTRICFRVGDDDAKKLADGFSFFEARDLQNLETGQAICRVERSDYDFNLAVARAEEPSEADATKRRQAVAAASRKKYGTPRAEVEATLYEEIHFEEQQSAATPSRGTPRGGRQARPQAPEAPPVPEPAPGTPPPASAPPPPGDQGQEEKPHTALKDRIGREAESLDYAVSFEDPIPGGEQRVDVVLRRGRRVVACEVSLKNAVEDEVANIRKCLKAGFRQVVVVCPSNTKLVHLREAIAAAFPPAEAALVACEQPDEFIAQLFEWAAEDPAGAEAERSKLRKQTITLDAGHLTEAERRAREREMLAQLAQTMRRKKAA